MRQQAVELVESLQQRLVSRVEELDAPLTPIRWLRDEGRHGGGVRYGTADTPVFGRASVNVSCIHYDDLPDKQLASATALSAIVHPCNPRQPSVHMHFSWTELRDGTAYWRMMADLNPSIEDPAATERFAGALREAAGEHYEDGRQQGDRYFFIPALGRHRGATHFYLEGFDTGDFAADLALARRIGEAAIDTYAAILAEAPEPEPGDAERQLAYHTLYLFQVLTLDRGTTSGLLVHDQNDVGILGSLPAKVDRALLASWKAKVPPPQDQLVERLVAELPASGLVDEGVKRRLAETVRAHYRAHPEALAMQARGNVIPPTVANHR